MTTKRALVWVLGIVFAIVIGILLATGIRSGILFQLDQDELVHAQDVYLLFHGVIPYRQFLLTYTPLFHFLIAPIFLFAGYTLKTMTLVRWFMAALFILRLALSGWVVLRIFGKRVALLFMLLFLMDPFTMYTVMQIRPDNLMMLLFTGGLAVLVLALTRKRYAYFFWSGFVFAASGLVLLKIAPSLLVVYIAMLWYGYTRHRYQAVRVFLLGSILPVLILFVFAASYGYLQPMLLGILKNSYAINQSQAFPVPITHFLESGNPALYDLYGETWSWWPIIEISEFVIAAAGLVLTTLTIFKNNRRSQNDVIIIAYILAGSLMLQATGLILVHSMFIQYFLPITWLINIFASIAIIWALGFLSRWKTLYNFVLVGVILEVLLLSYYGAKVNISRSYSVTNTTMTWVKAMLAQVPENATVYPNLPFRPIAYPIAFGGYFIDLPPSVMSQFPPLVPTLEKNRVQYILKTYDWKAHPQDFFLYVSNRFHEISPDVYIRND